MPGSVMDNLAPAALNTDLSGLFAPRSVALVGATDHPSNFGGRVFRAMLNFGYKGKIFPVNPRLKEIYGLACYSSVNDLPETPDHVGIIVATERVFAIRGDRHARRPRAAGTVDRVRALVRHAHHGPQLQRRNQLHR